MRANCYEIDAQGRTVRAELAETIARWRDTNRSFWIDVEHAERGEVEGLLGELGLARELIDQFLELGHAARIVSFDEGLFFELPLEITGQPAEVKSAAFVYLDRLVVTHREDVYDSSSWVEATNLPRLDPGGAPAIALVCVLLIELSVSLRRQSLEVRRTLVELTERLDKDSRPVSLGEMVNLKRRIVDLDAIIEEREAVLESLRAAALFRDAPDSAAKLGIALGNTAATARRLDRLDRRAEALQARCDAAAQEKTNRRLGRLTIISAVFLPLTLIAGIYGMNFEVMPELQYPLAYPLTLAGMVVVAIALLWWFRSRGWMD